ncbi:MAG: TetR family transcriptional regulator [Streptomycetaceae bacterium]|nr:TetR family transcriptional regulator [Streptomycetaceae bacterium]
MGLREQTRSAVRNAIAERAVALFDEKGFDATTVDDIAAAAGISARSFFRYFPAKEDAVIGDQTELGGLVRDALAARPADEPPWRAMRAALRPVVELVEQDVERSLRTVRVLTSTASLRARNLEKHILWGHMLTPLMAQRLGPSATGDVPAQAIVVAGLSCLDVAFGGWVAAEGDADFGGLLDAAFAAVGD